MSILCLLLNCFGSRRRLGRLQFRQLLNDDVLLLYPIPIGEQCVGTILAAVLLQGRFALLDEPPLLLNLFHKPVGRFATRPRPELEIPLHVCASERVRNSG